MRQATLGKTGIRISQLCFGTFRIHQWNTKKGAAFLTKAYRKGVTFWDTADCYGTYRLVKQALKAVPRGRVVIQSKICAGTKAHATRLVKQALREMGVKYIDIMLLHAVKSVRDWHERRPAYEALLEAKRKGLVRAVGFSTHSSPAAVMLNADNNLIDVILVSVHPKHIDHGTRLQMLRAVRACKKAGKGMIAMKIMGVGKETRRAKDALEDIVEKKVFDAYNLGMTAEGQLALNCRVLS